MFWHQGPTGRASATVHPPCGGLQPSRQFWAFRSRLSALRCPSRLQPGAGQANSSWGPQDAMSKPLQKLPVGLWSSLRTPPLSAPPENGLFSRGRPGLNRLLGLTNGDEVLPGNLIWGEQLIPASGLFSPCDWSAQPKNLAAKRHCSSSSFITSETPCGT